MPEQKQVAQGSLVTLHCPHARGDVTWSRYIDGKRVTILTTKNDHEHRTNKRFGSLANYSLFIMNVESSDTTMYLCNGVPTVYLNVTQKGNIPVTPVDGGRRFDFEEGEEGTDAEDKPSSDIWKVPVGVVIGAALVLLAFTLRFCSNRSKRNRHQETTVKERIYEEIQHGNMQLRRNPEVGGPTETQSSPTPAENVLYDTVNMLKPNVNRSDECVYSLIQKGRIL